MLLSIYNIYIRHTSIKLEDKFLRLFSIVKSVSINTYRLNLSIKYEYLHLVFYISLLESY